MKQIAMNLNFSNKGANKFLFFEHMEQVMPWAAG